MFPRFSPAFAADAVSSLSFEADVLLSLGFVVDVVLFGRAAVLDGKRRLLRQGLFALLQISKSQRQGTRRHTLFLRQLSLSLVVQRSAPRLVVFV